MAEMTIGQVLEESRLKALAGEPNHAELSFRRGFNQGFEQALQIFKSGIPLDRIVRHADRIERWRQDGLRDQGFSPPPQFRIGSPD